MGDISIKPGENAIMSCEIFGYPASSVIWTFIPCNKPEFDINSCDESKKLIYVSASTQGNYVVWIWFSLLYYVYVITPELVT